MFNVDERNKFQLISHLIVYTEPEANKTDEISRLTTLAKENMLLMLLKTENWSRKQFPTSSPGDVRLRFFENIVGSKASRFQLPASLDAK